MLNFFRKKTEKEKLQQNYEKLMAEAYRLSHTDRRAADEKTTEAEAVAKRIERL